MLDLLESLTKQLTTQWKRRKPEERFSRAYHCRCGAAIFFSNTQCLRCESQLGYLSDTLSLVALDPGPEPGRLRADGMATSTNLGPLC